MSRTLLATMTVPIPFPDPARGDEAVRSGRAAAFVARWVGEHAGLATFQHQLATLPVGARLRDSLTLGATGALGCWALGAGVVAGGLELLTSPGRHRAGKTAPVVRHVEGPAGEGAGSID